MTEQQSAQPTIQPPSAQGNGTPKDPPPPNWTSALDHFASSGGPDGITVTRIAPQKGSRGRSAEKGVCGVIPNADGFLEIIGDRWGGGTYRAQGKGSDGKPVSQVFELPGPSRPITESVYDDDDDDDVHLPPPGIPPMGPMLDQWGRPMYPPPPQAQPPVPDWWASVYGNKPEDGRIQRELDDARRDLKVEQARREQAERDAERARDALERAKERHQDELRYMRLEARLEGGTAGGSDSAELLKAQLEMMRTNAERENALVQAKSDQDRHFMDRVLEQSSKLDPMAMMSQLNKMNGGGLGQIKDLIEVSALLRELGPGSDDDDFSWKGVIKALGPALRDVIDRQREEDAEETAVETEPAQAKPLPAPPEPDPEDGVTAENWSMILEQVGSFAKAKKDPGRAADAIRGYCRGMGPKVETDVLESLKGATTQSLIKELNGIAIAMPSDPMRDRLVGFLELMEDKDRKVWMSQFLKAFLG